MPFDPDDRLSLANTSCQPAVDHVVLIDTFTTNSFQY